MLGSQRRFKPHGDPPENGLRPGLFGDTIFFSSPTLFFSGPSTFPVRTAQSLEDPEYDPFLGEGAVLDTAMTSPSHLAAPATDNAIHPLERNASTTTTTTTATATPDTPTDHRPATAAVNHIGGASVSPAADPAAFHELQPDLAFADRNTFPLAAAAAAADLQLFSDVSGFGGGHSLSTAAVAAAAAVEHVSASAAPAAAAAAAAASAPTPADILSMNTYYTTGTSATSFGHHAASHHNMNSFVNPRELAPCLDPSTMQLDHAHLADFHPNNSASPATTLGEPASMTGTPGPGLAKHGNGVAAGPDSKKLGGLDSFARLKFADGTFFMTTYSVIIGRDQLAIDQARRDQRKGISQHGGGGGMGGAAGAGDNVFQDQTDLLQKPHRKKFSRSYISEEGGIIGPEADDDGRPPKRRKTRSRESASQGDGTGPAADGTATATGAAQNHDGTARDDDVVPDRQYILNHTPNSAMVDIETHQPSPNRVAFVGIHSPGPDMVAKTKTISRKHLKIEYNFQKGVFEATPLHLNGFFHNEEYVRDHAVVLRSGDALQIKDISFTFIISTVRRGCTGAEPSAKKKGSGGKTMSFDFEGHHDGNARDTSEESGSDTEQQQQAAHNGAGKGGKGGKAKGKAKAKKAPRVDDGGEGAPDDAAQKSVIRPGEPCNEELMQAAAEIGMLSLPEAPKKRGPGRPPKNGIMSMKDAKRVIKAAQDKKHAAMTAVGVYAPPYPGFTAGPIPVKLETSDVTSMSGVPEASVSATPEAVGLTATPVASSVATIPEGTPAVYGDNGTPHLAAVGLNSNGNSNGGGAGIATPAAAVPMMDYGFGTPTTGTPVTATPPMKRKVGRPRKYPLPDNAEHQPEKRRYKPRKPKTDEERASGAGGGHGGGDSESETGGADPRRQERHKTPPLELNRADFTDEQLAKPNKNYGLLIHEVLLEATEGLTLKQVYKRIQMKYPYFFFEVETKGWESSVRHNLIGNYAFMKVEESQRWFRVPNVSLEEGKRLAAQAAAQAAEEKSRTSGQSRHSNVAGLMQLHEQQQQQAAQQQQQQQQQAANGGHYGGLQQPGHLGQPGQPGQPMAAYGQPGVPPQMAQMQQPQQPPLPVAAAGAGPSNGAMPPAGVYSPALSQSTVRSPSVPSQQRPAQSQLMQQASHGGASQSWQATAVPNGGGVPAQAQHAQSQVQHAPAARLGPAVAPETSMLVRNFKAQVQKQAGRLTPYAEEVAMSVVNRCLGLSTESTAPNKDGSVASGQGDTVDLEKVILGVFEKSLERQLAGTPAINPQLLDQLLKVKRTFTGFIGEKMGMPRAQMLILSAIDQVLGFTDRSLMHPATEVERREFAGSEKLILDHLRELVRAYDSR